MRLDYEMNVSGWYDEKSDTISWTTTTVVRNLWSMEHDKETNAITEDRNNFL